MRKFIWIGLVMFLAGCSKPVFHATDAKSGDEAIKEMGSKLSEKDRQALVSSYHTIIFQENSARQLKHEKPDDDATVKSLDGLTPAEINEKAKELQKAAAAASPAK